MSNNSKNSQLEISVVIPTYNNSAVLNRCLQYLNKQRLTDHLIKWEVVVVDDGSTDDTAKLLTEWSKRPLSFDLTCLQQTNKKQAAARNYGASRARGSVLIFIGADILVQENFLQEHWRFHQKFANENSMAVGFMTWSPELSKDRFRQWLESSGTMLSFKSLQNYRPTDYWHFYTGNVSLKKSWFTQFKFDEKFLTYGWEDIALGYQMLKSGGQLYYLAKAKAYHHHSLTKADFFPTRMRQIGQSAILLARKFPQIPVLPTGLKLIIFKLLTYNLTIKILKLLKLEWAWYALSKKYFLEGVKSKNCPLPH
jgi:glycosyltransferase involved in cell wall biosynthesis